MYFSNKYQTHETAAWTGGGIGGQFLGNLAQQEDCGSGDIMVRSWNITHTLVSSVVFHSNQQLGNVQLNTCYVVFIMHTQSVQLIIWNQYAMLSVISSHIYLFILLSIYRKVANQLASWNIPAVVWLSLAFIYTATTFWYCFHFEIYNIHTGWVSDWMGEAETFGKNEAKKTKPSLCLAQLLSIITSNSMVWRQNQINLSSVCARKTWALGGQEKNVVVKQQMSEIMKEYDRKEWEQVRAFRGHFQPVLLG